MGRFLGNIIVGFLALYLATLLVPGVEAQGVFEEQIKVLFFAGVVLGLVNFFIKPIVNLITFPLRSGLGGLFWTGLIAWILSLFFIGKRRPKLKGTQ